MPPILTCFGEMQVAVSPTCRYKDAGKKEPARGGLVMVRPVAKTTGAYASYWILAFSRSEFWNWLSF
jgi:hypothetical protein